ncbi:protein PALS2-like [Ciona intestinalis]
MPQERSQKDAVETVLKKLNSERPNSIPEKDLVFLKVIMDSPVVQSLVKAHGTLGFGKLTPESDQLCVLVEEVGQNLEKSDNELELCKIFQHAHVRCLFQAHDKISSLRNRQYVNMLGPGNGEWKNAVRMIGMSKKNDENLGLTVALVGEDIKVTRILHGGLIHKQGLLHEGDIITEINGNNVKGNPELLKEYLKKSDGSFVLKTIPSYNSLPSEGDIFVKCNFNYSPHEDAMIPSKEAGLSFSRNDVIKIVDRRDLKWWQAQHVNEKGEPQGRAGLIPSQDLQERRQVNTMSVKSKPALQMYKLSQHDQFSFGGVNLYEEVTNMPPFTRKLVILLSEDPEFAHKVKVKLVKTFQHLYKQPVTHTSNKDKSDNANYHVTDKDKMLDDIRKNLYFEHGYYGDQIFGTKYKSVSNVMKSGKICVKNSSPKDLNYLMTSEFMPYVVNLHPVKEQETNTMGQYMHLVNVTLTCESEEAYCAKVHEEIQALSTRSQWVPITWVY